MALALAPNITPFSPLLRAGLTYLNRGWSVIPIRAGSKLPQIVWAPYQERLATDEELEDWCERWPAMNLAIVTGRISDLTVMDVDPDKGGMESLTHIRTLGITLPPTRIAQTPHAGFHYYFKYTKGVPTGTDVLPGIDVRSEGGYVLVPPSRLA